MQQIVTVRYQDAGKSYDFDPVGLPLHLGDYVVVSTSQGEAFAKVVRSVRSVDEESLERELSPVLRIATPKDILHAKELKQKERATLKLCRQRVEKHELEMKVIAVQYSFDGDKVLVMFTADGRVDFRALVRDLASTLKKRVELRQIGVRDETRILGGIAPCGKVFCCNQFLKEFQPVSIKMAKTQGLSLNPTKISGACGRLMCCLKYEQVAYEDAVKRMPKDGSYVETPDGVGTIQGVNMLRETVKVRISESNEPPKNYYTDEIHVVRSGKGKVPEDYTPPPLAEMAKRRRAVEASAEDAPLISSLGTRISGLEVYDEMTQQQPQQSNRRSRNRNRKRQGGGQPPQDKQSKPMKKDKPLNNTNPEGKKQGASNQQKPQGAKPKPQGGKPRAEGKPKQAEGKPKQSEAGKAPHQGQNRNRRPQRRNNNANKQEHKPKEPQS